MPRGFAQACVSRSGVATAAPAEITRCVLDSMAIAIRQALHDAVALSGSTVEVVHVVGGAVANAPFCQLIADACQLPVLAGPTEAVTWGTAVYQARAVGAISGTPADT